MNILIKFPTRNRPERFFKTLDLYYSMAANVSNIRFIVSLDADDCSMNNELIKNKLEKYPNLSYFIGNNKSKIEAINANMDNQNFDILISASDDMVPAAFGYDEIIREDMKTTYPDGDGALWYNDGYQEMRLNTICIMGKKYYDRFGYIYHPDYKSLYCDNEYTIVGCMNNKLTYFDKRIILHEHPDCNSNVPFDDLYIKNNNLLEYDRDIFHKRQSLNFPHRSINKSNSQWTFGITSENFILNENGTLNLENNERVIAIIESIKNLNIHHSNFEIILIGNNNLKTNFEFENIKIIHFDETINPKWITKKKNIIFDLAKFENCVVVHDYIIFDPDWYEGFLKFETDWDVCMCKLRTLSGIRWRDWVLGWDQEAPYRIEHRGVLLHKNRLLYDDTNYTSTNMYISGSMIIGKSEYLRKNKLNESLVWGQGEDDEWSRRCRPTWIYKMNTMSTMRIIKEVSMN